MLKRHLALVVVLVTLIAQTALAADKFKLPDEIRELIPADAVAVVAAVSVDEVEAMIVALEAQFDYGGEPSTPIGESMAAEMPELMEYLDTTRPLAVAMGMPNIMAGAMPDLTYILPLKNSAAVDDSLGAQWGFQGQALAGRYLAVSSAAGYLPSDSPADLGDHLNAGIASVTLDFAAIYQELGGFLEMGLDGIPVREAGTEPDSTGAMSVEEAETIKDILRNSLAALTRIDFSCDLDDDDFSMHTGIGYVPGSSLDPGPQPNFDDAIALTRALPTNADFFQVTAVDYTAIMNTFREYYIMAAGQSMVGLDDEQRTNYRAWVEQYLDGLELWSQPMATALRLSDSQMAFHGLMEVSDGEAAVEQLTETFAGLSAIDMGYTVERQADEEVAGVAFRVWEVDMDMEKIESMVTDNRSPTMSGASRLEAEQMIAVLRKVMSRIYIGADDGMLFLASDSDTESLAEMIKKAGDKGKPDANILRIAKENGDQTQQIITGDMMAVVNWFTEWLEEMDSEERDVMEGNPVPFEAAATIDNGAAGIAFKTSLSALGDLARAFAELDEMDGAGDHPEHPSKGDE